MDSKTSLLQAIQYFADFEHCREFMIQLRWPDGVVTCPQCGSDHVTWLAKARVWKCYAKHPQPRFSLKTGTIFEDSPLPLEKWLPAAWMLINCKNGISSYELHRDLRVTQKTAWFMLHRIRLAMQSKTFNKLGGEVEIDETFIGGKARNMHKDRRERLMIGLGGVTMQGQGNKACVQGFLERGGEVRAVVIRNTRKENMIPNVQKHVSQDATVYTDEAGAYTALDAEYEHQVINHLETYVNGNIHTNGIENFWSLLKRGLTGTYISVEPFHLFRYVDEQAFRFNHRRLTDAERFAVVIKQIVDRRVTYKELTGKQEVISHG